MTCHCRKLIRARTRGCRAAEPAVWDKQRLQSRKRWKPLMIMVVVVVARHPRSTSEAARDEERARRLTVSTGVIGGAVNGAVGEQLQVAIFNEHLYLASSAGDVGEVGAAFAACRWIL